MGEIVQSHPHSLCPVPRSVVNCQYYDLELDDKKIKIHFIFLINGLKQLDFFEYEDIAIFISRYRIVIRTSHIILYNSAFISRKRREVILVHVRKLIYLKLTYDLKKFFFEPNYRHIPLILSVFLSKFLDKIYQVLYSFH